jgi:hypothetical protein
VLKKLKNQDGFAYLLDCLLVIICCFCVSIIAWGSLGSKVLGEVGDVGAMIGSLNQSYTLTGIAVGHPNDPNHPTDVATWAGSSFTDTQDFCDQSSSCGVRACQAPTQEPLAGGGGPPPPIGP